jgi:argonaute-like protein implicated in RNA metabolism and viral defense
MAKLFAEDLDDPEYRFDYSNPRHTGKNVGKGLSTYGPYDSSTNRDFTDCSIGIVYLSAYQDEMDTFKDALMNGHGYFQDGFEKFFRMDRVEISNTYEITQDNIEGYEETIDDIRSEDDDIIVVVLSEEMKKRGLKSPYHVFKAELTNDGIPSQMVTKEEINSNLKYIIVNTAAQMYAKLGGTPWVLNNTSSDADLVIGLGKSEYKEERVGSPRRTVGFASAYKSNGAFLYYGSTSETTEYKELNSERESVIEKIVSNYSESEGEPDKIIIHSYKRIGDNLRDIKSELESKFDCNVILVHLNISNLFRIYDPNDGTGLPESGFMARTGGNKFLLMTDGRDKNRISSAKPIDITVEGDYDSLENIAEDCYKQCFVYWKDQFGTNQPFTIKYAEDIADQIEKARELNDRGFVDIKNDTIAHPRIEDYPWFL